MPDRKFRKHKKTPVLGRLLICNSKLVRHRTTFWNHFFDSLLTLDAKLTKLGLVYRNGQVTVCGLEEDL
jgi:hypothetical protein